MEQSRVLRLTTVLLLAAALLALPVSGVVISGQGVDITVTETPAAPVVGGDKDAHGCIGSAGYSWCEAKQKCLREWEEPCAAAPTPGPTTVMPGSDRDEHGCIGSAGYTWCEAKQKCLRVWEEPCTPATPAANAVPAAAPTTAKSPLPAVLVIGALGAACALAAVRKDR
jgi:hypothetical protein